MHKKTRFKAIMGNTFLSIGVLVNILVIFRLGFVSCFWGFSDKGISFSLFFICVTLINFIAGLIPYIPGLFILFFNRSKYKFFNINILAIFLIHLTISIAYTFKFTIG